MNNTPETIALFRELFEFVDVTLSTEVLTPATSAQRSNLVVKLTPYVQTPPALRYGSSYLDMTAGTNQAISAIPIEDLQEYVDADAIVEEEYEECPAEFEAVLEEKARIQNVQPTVVTKEPSDKADKPIISAGELKEIAIKVGPLLRKDRILFIEKFCRYWVAIHKSFMYFYNTEKDSKPTCVIDLFEFQARLMPNPTKDAKRRDNIFELVSPGKKTIQLAAQTIKDMHQWVAMIGRTNANRPRTPRRELPSIPDSDEDEVDSFPDRQATSIPVDDDDIYHCIGMDDEELYDDISQYPNSIYYNAAPDPHISANSKDTEQNVWVEKEEEEELYDEISHYQEKSTPQSENTCLGTEAAEAQIVKLVEKNEDEEELYDDISSYNVTNLAAKSVGSMGMKSKSIDVVTESQTVSEVAKHYVEEEDLYNDVTSCPASESSTNAKHRLGVVGTISKPTIKGAKPQLGLKGIKSNPTLKEMKPQIGVVGMKSQHPSINIQNLILRMESSLKLTNSEDHKQANSQSPQ